MQLAGLGRLACGMGQGMGYVFPDIPNVPSKVRLVHGRT